MESFTISFSFRGANHPAIVEFSPFTKSYCFYFADVEMILEFGGKAQLHPDGSWQFAKEDSSDLPMIKQSIRNELTEVLKVA